MIPHHSAHRTQAVLCGVIAFFLMAGAARAQSAPAKPTKTPAKTAKKAASKTPTSSAAAPVVSVEEGLQLVKKSPKDSGAYLALGGAYRRAGRYQDAVDTYKKLVALDPNNSTGHVSLGAVYMDLKRPDEAEVEFRKAIKLNPAEPEFHALSDAIQRAQTSTVP